MRRKAVGFYTVGVLALTSVVGCSTPTTTWRVPKLAKTDAKQEKAPLFVSPARLIALPTGRTPANGYEDVDGRYLVFNGIRLVDHRDGSLELATQLFPEQGRSQSPPINHVRLPKRIGGGLLFYMTVDARTYLWRSETWTGDLKPIANLPFTASTVTPGFDRLYVSDGNDLVALDLEAGTIVDNGALPPAPIYRSMAMAGPWLGAVETDVRGVLVTFDAGASWRPVGQTSSGYSQGVSLVDDELKINLNGRNYIVEPSGDLRTWTGPGRRSTSYRGPATAAATMALADQGTKKRKPNRPVLPLGPRPLREAVLYGWPVSSKAAVVAHAGTLARVSLDNGKILASEKDAYVGEGDCQAIPLGGGFGFVCGQERGRTDIYAFEPPLTMRPVISFDEPRYVGASDSGGLVIRGGCGRQRSKGNVYCVSTPKGELRELRVSGDSGVERVAMLRDGRAAVLVPPRLGAKGMLTLVDKRGKAKTTALKFPKDADKTEIALLKKGLWMDGIVERRAGVLSAWVAGGGPYIGVRIHEDGKVDLGRLQDDIDRSLVSGPFALALGRGGVAWETTDGGFKWRELSAPTGFADRGSGLPRLGSQAARKPRGCSRNGCAFGPWVRVGWSKITRDEKKPDPDDKSAPETAAPEDATTIVELPAHTDLEKSFPGRWNFKCAYNGKSKKFAAVPKPKATDAKPSPSRYSWRYRGRWGTLPAAKELDDQPFTAFRSIAPPNKGRGAIGFEFDLNATIHGYAWGPREGSWGQSGHWLLRARSQFDIDKPVWSTAGDSAPFKDAVSAAKVHGTLNSYGYYTSWRFGQDPMDRGGMLVMTSRGTMEAYIVEDGRRPTKISTNNIWGLNSMSGAVKANNTWYVASTANSYSVSLYRVEGDRLATFKEYPTMGRYSAGIQIKLVRSARGDALGLLAWSDRLRSNTKKWHVYPLDPATGEAGEALVIEPTSFGSKARVCDSDEDGWVITETAPVEPSITFTGTASSLRASSPKVRVIASHEGVCAERLSTGWSGSLPKGGMRADVAPGDGPTVQMVASSSDGGEHYAFTCRL